MQHQLTSKYLTAGCSVFHTKLQCVCGWQDQALGITEEKSRKVAEWLWSVHKWEEGKKEREKEIGSGLRPENIL